MADDEKVREALDYLTGFTGLPFTAEERIKKAAKLLNDSLRQLSLVEPEEAIVVEVDDDFPHPDSRWLDDFGTHWERPLPPPRRPRQLSLWEKIKHQLGL